MKERTRFLAAGLLAGAGITVAGAGQAHADKLVVKNKKPRGKGSFAHAVRKANSDRDRDKIVFRSRLSGAIDVRHDIEVSRPLKIDGKGRAPKLRAVRKADSIEFGAHGHSALLGLELDGLQVANGNDFRSEDLLIRDTTLRGDGEGTGVYLYGYGNGGIRMKRSTITGFDRGVYAVKLAHMTIAHSKITDNHGGGGVADTVYAHVDITDSTISGNTAGNHGGGGVRAGYESSIDIDGSTITGNDAVNGGGVYGYGDVAITDSTISGNHATHGGGVYAYGHVTISDSTVSGNHSAEGGADCAGPNVIDRGGNEFGDPTDCGS